MRQFVLGLIVAGAAWWGYGKWLSDNPNPAQNPANTGAGAQNSTVPTGAGSGDPIRHGSGSLGELLQGGSDSSGLRASGPQDASVDGADGQVAASSGASTGNALEEDLSELLPLVAAGDLGAVSMAWAAVASGQLGAQHERVVVALAPRAEDFASQLTALGSNNAFLHSAVGRAQAKKTLQAAMALPDSEAIKAGTQLVYLMARGRMNRQDKAARAAIDEAYKQHRIRVDRWLCNPTNLAGARTYTVQSGNSLDGISAKFRRQGLKIEAGTIAVLNRISNPELVRQGQKLKIPVAPIYAVLEKRSYAFMVFVGDDLLRLYWVGHGENDRTPVTEFTVIAKQANPQWTSPDGNVYPYGHPENILGEFFVKFGHDQYSGFGAHGTPMPETICTMSSMGCIRMFDDDIKEFCYIMPRGAKVVVAASNSIH